MFCLILFVCLFGHGAKVLSSSCLYHFYSCETTCSKKCQARCPCQNGGICKGKGICTCPPGWTVCFQLTSRCFYTYWCIHCINDTMCHSSTSTVCVQTSVFTLVQMPDHWQSAMFPWLIERKSPSLNWHIGQSDSCK